MDQKNKLAYENGRLLTQVEQTAVELENLRKADLESAHYRKISDTLQNKYAQVCCLLHVLLLYFDLLKELIDSKVIVY